MKIQKCFVNDAHYMKKWKYIMFIIFAIGICGGTIYSVFLNQEADKSLGGYLMSYFDNISTVNGLLKNSLIDWLRLFIIIFICSFVRLGVVPIMGAVFMKGFVTGFTSACFVKYFDSAGMLASVATLPVIILYLPALIIFSSGAIIFSINRYRNDKIKFYRFLLLSFCCLTIFCVVAFADAFLTTTFMKFFAPIIVAK